MLEFKIPIVLTGPIVGAIPCVELDENSLYYSSYVISVKEAFSIQVPLFNTIWLLRGLWFVNWRFGSNSTVSGINIASYSYGAYSIYDLNFT